jgi:hypothetical protein
MGQAEFLLSLRLMHRSTRIHIDSLPLHIVQRSHNRAAGFFDDQDRRANLGWLREALVRERCRTHAYGPIRKRGRAQLGSLPSGGFN